ncbi:MULTISPECIES: META domain-containing protein [unclassified Pseudomonas]|uniref:META domain-containing protein n=1 Tax=unclassified Pseudomonas TaxID=196821 RepID=UPI002AC974F1|nr:MULTISPECIES: META domain-containing protein [unclassified Pseudomonas]MEB0041273.1 META domain-containing protein [Pseudomonas sp. MH10]MEB0075860.1 META domain-containing protein [Pseudomonas sp. MH10out]MEB0091496.1 META domain-containing protein [Pseudomonas sp. CCI4.2]MEB0104349.1 META domain-containing protein [Pseudomonas sp. CCI3.2]MEB0131614.1 META domain-containing protein [Pseudomonas sp. CCI2.4]
MRRAVLLGLLGSTLLGCAAEPPGVQHDHSYLLEWIGERPLVDRSHLTMTLGKDGRAYGNAGCNHWFAPYAQDGERFHFGMVGSTRRVCSPALMEQEQRFLDALTKVQRWDISPIEQLRLWPEEGKPLRFWLEDS